MHLTYSIMAYERVWDDWRDRGCASLTEDPRVLRTGNTLIMLFKQSSIEVEAMEIQHLLELALI